MNYADALAHLAALTPELSPSSSTPGAVGTSASASPRRKFDLAHMRILCERLGNPQNQVPSLLIAGTNGKGSTSATLASILNAAGYRTGLYTSPHLLRVNERIQLSGPTLPSEYGSLSTHAGDGALALTPIHDEDFARLYTLVDEASDALVAEGALPWLPSFFERLTALAFVYFAGTDEPDAVPRAEIMVLEVGLGGRLDATNVVEPLISILTDIALDHQDYLGNTLTEIAGEKAGILRENGLLVTLSQHPEANQVIGLRAAELNVTGIDAARYLPPARRNTSLDHADEAQPDDWHASLRNQYRLALDDATEPGEIEIDSPLPGSHQQRNLALTLATAIALRNRFSYNISNAALAAGIRNTYWPGRLQLVSPHLLVDVAHNPAGAWTLRSAIAALPGAMPRTLLFSCLRDKDLTEISRILFPLFDSSPDGDPLRRHDHIVLAPIDNARAASMEELLAAAHSQGIPAHAAPHAAAALAQARQVTPADGLIIATGSIFLIAEILALASTHHEAPVA